MLNKKDIPISVLIFFWPFLAHYLISYVSYYFIVPLVLTPHFLFLYFRKNMLMAEKIEEKSIFIKKRGGRTLKMILIIFTIQGMIASVLYFINILN